MPVSNEETAYDEIMGAVKTAWDAGADTSGVTLLWEGVAGERPTAPQTGKPGTVEAWGWAQFRHDDGGLATFGAEGSKRYRREGLLTVQVFAPLTDGLTKAHKIARIVVEGLEGTRTAGGVVFRRVRPVEVGHDGPWFQLNIYAGVEYHII